jgi:leucyl aminopeptidase
MKNSKTLIPEGQIEQNILIIRGQKVIIDSDLARLYGVATKALNQAVKRNAERFPDDFAFRLSPEEAADFLRIRKVSAIKKENRSQAVTGSQKHRDPRNLPYAFTEHGALMAANILRSQRAVEMSVFVVRAFVRLRQLLASNAELARKLNVLEKKYDAQFKVVFDAIRQLMEPPKTKRRRIGFLGENGKA